MFGSNATSLPSCSACVDTFMSTSDMSLPGGSLVQGVNTNANCKANCLTVPFDQCAGYDFDSGNRCYKFTFAQLSGTLRPAAGVTHSVRTQCDATTTVGKLDRAPNAVAADFNSLFSTWLRQTNDFNKIASNLLDINCMGQGLEYALPQVSFVLITSKGTVIIYP